MDLKKLRERREELTQKMRVMVDAAEEEDRGFDSEEDEKWQRMLSEIDELDERIKHAEELEREERYLDQSQGVVAARQDTDDGKTREERTEDIGMFERFLRGGMRNLSVEERDRMLNRQVDLSNEARALATADDTLGGYLVPEGFASQIIEEMSFFGGMRESRATVLQTDNGRKIPYPKTGAAEKGARVSENEAIGTYDESFEQVIIDSFIYTSKILKVPVTLLQDSAFDIESWLRARIAERIGRILNEELTTGNDDDMPEGIVTASSKGADAAAADALGYDDFVNLEHGVDRDYRANAQWMMSDDAVKESKLIKSSDGFPIWRPGMTGNDPNEILGYPYVVNSDMDTVATGNKPVLFGDLSRYLIRDVSGLTVVRFDEKYMDSLQVGFLAFSRHDGALLDDNAVKHLLMA